MIVHWNTLYLTGLYSRTKYPYQKRVSKMDVQTRQAYFDSNEQINLDKEKFDHDWPYLKNIWTVDQTSKGKKATLITYWCKLNRHRNQRAEPKEIKRNRKSKSENACPGRLRIKIFNGDDQVRYHQIVKLHIQWNLTIK